MRLDDLVDRHLVEIGSFGTPSPGGWFLYGRYSASFTSIAILIQVGSQAYQFSSFLDLSTPKLSPGHFVVSVQAGHLFTEAARKSGLFDHNLGKVVIDLHGQANQVWRLRNWPKHAEEWWRTR